MINLSTTPPGSAISETSSKYPPSSALSLSLSPPIHKSSSKSSKSTLNTATSNNKRTSSSSSSSRQRPKIFICSVPGCRKPFSKKWNMQAHMRLHTGSTPFACRLGCGASYMWMSSRKGHELNRCRLAAFIPSEMNPSKRPSRYRRSTTATAAAQSQPPTQQPQPQPQPQPTQSIITSQHPTYSEVNHHSSYQYQTPNNDEQSPISNGYEYYSNLNTQGPQEQQNSSSSLYQTPNCSSNRILISPKSTNVQQQQNQPSLEMISSSTQQNCSIDSSHVSSEIAQEEPSISPVTPTTIVTTTTLTETEVEISFSSGHSWISSEDNVPSALSNEVSCKSEPVLMKQHNENVQRMAINNVKRQSISSESCSDLVKPTVQTNVGKAEYKKIKVETDTTVQDKEEFIEDIDSLDRLECASFMSDVTAGTEINKRKAATTEKEFELSSFCGPDQRKERSTSVRQEGYGNVYLAGDVLADVCLPDRDNFSEEFLEHLLM